MPLQICNTTSFSVLYTVSQKSILDIFDCDFKTNYQILIILGANIFLLLFFSNNAHILLE